MRKIVQSAIVAGLILWPVAATASASDGEADARDTATAVDAMSHTGERTGAIAVTAGLARIREAALQSQSEMAAPLFDPDMALISQSGKLYGKEAALFDLQNGFDAWCNTDVVIRDLGDHVVVTLINNRTRTGMKPARFRVLQLWRNVEGNWLLSAQSSAAIR